MASCTLDARERIHLFRCFGINGISTGRAQAHLNASSKQSGLERGGSQSKVAGFQAGMFCDSYQHARTNFLTIMESKNKVWKTVSLVGLYAIQKYA